MRIANPDKLNLKGDIFRHTIPENRKLTLKIMTLTLNNLISEKTDPEYQNISEYIEYVKICQNMSEYVQIYQVISEYIRSYKNISGYIRIYQNV